MATQSRVTDTVSVDRTLTLMLFCQTWLCTRAPDKEHIFISNMPISSPNSMSDHLLESSHRDDSNKWLNIGFSEEITQIEPIECLFTYFIWCSVCTSLETFIVNHTEVR